MDKDTETKQTGMARRSFSVRNFLPRNPQQSPRRSAPLAFVMQIPGRAPEGLLLLKLPEFCVCSSKKADWGSWETQPASQLGPTDHTELLLSGSAWGVAGSSSWPLSEVKYRTRMVWPALGGWQRFPDQSGLAWTFQNNRGL